VTGHTHKQLFAIAITLALFAGTACGAELTWTDDAGKFSVTAELVALEGDKVVLRRQDGKQITMQLEDNTLVTSYSYGGVDFSTTHIPRNARQSRPLAATVSD